MIHTNLLTKQKETHRCGEQAYGCRGREGKVGKAIVREFGMAVYTLLGCKEIQPVNPKGNQS